MGPETSPHFTPVVLEESFNADRQKLNDSLRLHQTSDKWYGFQNVQGFPFQLGSAGQPNVILLEQETVHIELNSTKATFVLFLHAVGDRLSMLPDDLAGTPDMPVATGNELGDVVSEYCLVYEDGSEETAVIQRRFAIQQARIGWGASPFSATSAAGPEITINSSEAFALGKKVNVSYGWGEVRHASGRESAPEHLWLYALPNPHPEKRIKQIKLTPKNETSVIYGMTHTQVYEHPLRPTQRKKVKLTLPTGATLNAIHELEEVYIDLGSVISARAALNYDREQWVSNMPDVQPLRSETAVIIEYAAHPAARLFVKTGPDAADYQIYDLSDLENEANLVQVNPAVRPVRVRVVEKSSNTAVPVRLHLHGAAGEYLPPKGYHRKVNDGWFEDNYGEFVNQHNQYCYIPGECVADLPLGDVFIEITRGYEIAPLRTSFQVEPNTNEITFELERVLDWRAKGWVTADTHVHFLSPQTALLEGSAEGINVVNLLASQWGEMFSNVADFDGRTTFGAREFGGDGEFLVRVGTENRMQVLGHISLLGYTGSMIHPLCSGGPSESALGDVLEVTMADWAQRCIDQNGLVIMPHAPNPQCERAADIILGLVHAIEMMTFTPYESQLNPYGLADWYRYLNLGYHLPLVGGSDKMGANILLGGMRTYAHLGEREFTYENWLTAVQAGHTFATVGPLVELKVEGHHPGQRLKLPATGGHLSVSWRVESASLPIDRVEIVVGGLTAEQVTVNGQLSAEGCIQLPITQSTWIALRVRGSYRRKHGDIAAHSSAVQVFVGDQPIFSQPEATAVLYQIEGAIAYVDTIAPRPAADAYKRLRATLESAYNRLHHRLHQQGVYHNHSLLGQDAHHS